MQLRIRVRSRHEHTHPYDLEEDRRVRYSVERDLRQRYPNAPATYCRREAHRPSEQLARHLLPDPPATGIIPASC